MLLTAHGLWHKAQQFIDPGCWMMANYNIIYLQWKELTPVEEGLPQDDTLQLFLPLRGGESCHFFLAVTWGNRERQVNKTVIRVTET